MVLLAPRDFAINDQTPQLPDTQLVPDMSSIKIGWINQASSPTVTLANQADNLVGHLDGFSKVVKSAALAERYQVSIFTSDQANNQWIMDAASPRRRRTLAFTPTLGQQASSNQAVTWTHVPLITGQVNDLFTLTSDNGGTRLTADVEMLIDASHAYLVDAVTSANNTDVSWLFDTGSSIISAGFLPNVANAFAHARSGTFSISQQSSGPIHMLAGDWLRIDFSRPDFSGSSDATITNGVLSLANILQL